MVKCSNCGWNNTGGVRNCEKCNTPLTYDVFISYSRKDYVDDAGNVLSNNILLNIKDNLKASGISYWFDEEGIYSGDEFASVITNAIRNSRIFLFISSVNSNQSRWTSNEISTALEFEKPIIPFRIDNSPYNDSVMMKIVSFDYIQCNDVEKAISKLLRAIKHHMPSSICQQKKSVIDVPDGAKGATVTFDVEGKRTVKVFSYEDGEAKRKAEEELQIIRTDKQQKETRDIKIRDNYKKKKEDYNAKLEGTLKDSRFSDKICEQIVKELEKPREIRLAEEKACTAFKYNTNRIIKEFWPFGLSILVFIGVICYGFYDEQIWKYNEFSDIALSLFCWSFVGFIFSSFLYSLAKILIVFTGDMGCKKGSIAFTFLLLILITIGIIIWEFN